VGRLIVDTNILIDADRGRMPLTGVISPEDDVAISMITAAELLLGVELADETHRRGRADFVERVLAGIPMIEYDLAVARSHARLLAHVRRTGTPRGAHDLIVAATAAATRRTVVSRDGSAYAQLPGVTARIV